MLHKQMLSQQQKLGRIQPINAIEMHQRIDAELKQLNKLQQRQASYLNQYDQLFRLITVWLLVQGFDLTNHQPHQVLKSVCSLQCPDVEVERMIQLRHQLKKGMWSPNQVLDTAALSICLNHFEAFLQAYVLVPKESFQATLHLNP